MAEIIRMPKLSDTMTEGVVAEWHKKIGDEVQSGELLAEIETDKATMEFESFNDGVLLHIGVEKGKAAPVNDILAIIGDKGEDIKSLLKEAESAPKEEPRKEAPVPAAEVLEPAPARKAEAVAPPASKPTPKPAEATTSDDNDRVKASPIARRLAAEKGINLSHVRGTGENGRITKRDVEHFGSHNTKAYVGRESYSEVEVSQMRKTIALRLAESKFAAPHFYLTMEIEMTAMMEARKSINEVASAKVSFNDLVIKGVAAALREHPKVNASWLGDRIRYNDHIHIGVAVAVEDGLLVPVVRFADGKTLTTIATEVRNYAQKAKDKKLQSEDWEGNTFTISNLGMFGIEEFTAIINPPDACILAVGGIKQAPVVMAGNIVPGNTMKVTLSCDHRVVDGATGSAFLQTFKHLMENPVVLLGSQSI